MQSLIIWWVGLLLQSLIVGRMLVRRTFVKYPYFFAYSTCVLAGNSWLLVINITSPSTYGTWYWRIDFLTLFIGCGIILEIFHHVLAPYPGAERFARTLGLLVFGAIFVFTFAYELLKPVGTPAATSFELERNLRTVQSIFLFVMLTVITYYRITLGKNMKGMISGYALYVATSLISLAFHTYAGTAFDEAWKSVQPASYDASLIVWLAALWSYSPSPVAQFPTGLE